MSFKNRTGVATSVVLEEGSIEDMIDSLSLMADQNVILAKSIVKKVEELQSERQRRKRDNFRNSGGATGPPG